MANVITQDDLGKDKLNLTNQNGSQTQSGVNSSSGPQQSTSNPSNPNKQQGSGFTNIQRVLSANQGNNLAQTVGGNIQQAGQQTSQNLNNAQNQFQQDSNTNKFDTDENRQFTNQALNDPTKFTNQATKFQGLLSGQYQGPQTLNNASQLQNQAQDLGQMGQALGTSGGRTGLLQRFVGNPQYQQGQQTLDNLLLGQSGNQQALTQARRQALGFKGQLNNALSGAQQQGLENVNNAQSFGQNLQNQFGQTVSGENSDLENKAQASQLSRDSLLNNVRQQLASGQLTQDEANQLGLHNGDMSFNIDPTKYFSASNVQANAQNVASADDYAKINALRQLAGNLAPTDAQDVLQKYYGQDQHAGEFDKTPAYALDKDRFQKDYQSSQQDYNSRYNPAFSGLQGAQDINNLVQQRDQANAQIKTVQDQLGQLGVQGAFSPQGQALQKQLQDLQNQAKNYQDTIGQKYGGAVTNGTTRTDWANSNLQNAQTNFDQIKKQLEDAYGTKKFSVS